MKIKKRVLILPAVAVFAITLALTACQSFGSAGALFQEPKVSFNSVDFADLTVNGLDLVAHVDVENSNLFPIPLPKVDWELFINEASFVKGEQTDGESIKSGGKTTLDIPLRLTYDGLLNTFTSLINTKEAAYNIALGLTFPIPFIGDKVYSLDFGGVLPLPRLPTLSGGSMGISKIDYSGVTLAYTVNVENPNIFSIPVPDIDLNYGVRGVEVLKRVDKTTGTIAAGAERPVSINMSIEYEDIFKAIGASAASSARNAGEVRSSLSLAALSPIPALSGAAHALDIPGTVPILRMPEISFQGITKKSLGRVMEFAFNFEVDNKNSFPYDIGEFLYNLNVNGTFWARGAVDNPPEVKPKSKTVIPVTARVSAVSIVAELVKIIGAGSQVDYNCSGSMSLLGGFAGAADKLDYPLNFSGSTRIR